MKTFKAPPAKTSPFTLPKLILQFKDFIQKLDDPRTGKNSFYTFQDIVFGAFSVFFTQSPSFLQNQKTMLQAKKKCNAQSLFLLKKIPTDNHIRTLIDKLPHQSFLPFFRHLFSKIYDTGFFQTYRTLDDQLLFALDEIQYFSSQKISKKGEIAYSHQMVAAAVIHPEREEVFPIEPEPIWPQEGKQKQDCEIEAAKRWQKNMEATIQKRELRFLEMICIPEAIYKVSKRKGV